MATRFTVRTVFSDMRCQAEIEPMSSAVDAYFDIMAKLSVCTRKASDATEAGVVLSDTVLVGLDIKRRKAMVELESLGFLYAFKEVEPLDLAIYSQYVLKATKQKARND